MRTPQVARWCWTHKTGAMVVGATIRCRHAGYQDPTCDITDVVVTEVVT